MKNIPNNTLRSYNLTVNTYKGLRLAAPARHFGVNTPTLTVWQRFVENIHSRDLTFSDVQRMGIITLEEIKRFFQQEACGFTSKVYRGPIRMSHAVKPQHYFIDEFGNITLNHDDCVNRYIDSDGDMATVIEKDEAGVIRGILVKYPLTKRPMIMTRMTEIPLENFNDFGDFTPMPLEEKLTLEQWKEKFIKKHLDAEVGIKQIHCDGKDLFHIWEKGLTGHEAHQYLGTDIYRATLIEEGGMKVNRKDDAEEVSIDSKIYDINKNLRQFLHKSALPVKDDLLYTDVQEIQERVWNLNSRVTCTPGNPDALKEEPKYRIYEKKALFNKLVKQGILKIEIIPHSDPVLKYIMRVQVTNQDGTPVGLTSIKRDSYSEVNYTFYVLPRILFVNEIGGKRGAGPAWRGTRTGRLYTTDEVLESKKGELMAGEMYERVILCRQNTRILFDTPEATLCKALGSVWIEAGRYDEYVGRDVNLWTKFQSDPSFATQVLRSLEEACGKYGYNCPTFNGIPNPVTLEMAKNVFNVEYFSSSAYKKVQMASFLLETYNKFKEAGLTDYMPSLLGGDKGKARTNQKYTLTKDISTMRPKWAPKGADATRCGHIKSQLANSKFLGKAVIAITGPSVEKSPTSSNQMFATPSGVKKQKLNHNLFMPIMVDPEETVGAIQHTFKDFSGKKQTVHLIDGRHTATTGKIITQYATKNMLAPIHQITANIAGKEYDVDFVMSRTEFEEKGALNAILQNEKAIRTTVEINGKEVEVMLVIIPVFRTLATGENVVPGPGKQRFSRLPGLFVAGAIERLDCYSETSLTSKGFGACDEKYLRALRRFFKQLERLSNLV